MLVIPSKLWSHTCSMIMVRESTRKMHRMNTKSLRFRMTAWYAGLLAGSLLLSGAFIYLGLENYLQRNLRTNLQEQAIRVADEVLEHVNSETQLSIPYLLKQRFVSQLNGRFIR